VTCEVKGEITQVNAVCCVVIKWGQFTIGKLVIQETQILS